jgi:hypothetical protein
LFCFFVCLGFCFHTEPSTHHWVPSSDVLQQLF